MNKFNKYVFIVCVAALGSACKSGGGSTSAESLNGESQEKFRAAGSSTFRSSNNNRITRSNRTATPAPKNAPSPRPEPRPTPTAAPQPSPDPIVVRPEPRPAPQPAPTPEPQPAPTVVGNAQLSWTIPTKRENGDSLTRSELSRYEVYYTSESGKSDTIKVTDTSRTALTVNNLEGDTYYFAMAAVDKDGIFSELSNEVPKTIK